MTEPSPEETSTSLIESKKTCLNKMLHTVTDGNKKETRPIEISYKFGIDFVSLQLNLRWKTLFGSSLP